jgi:putative SOS response-associated peptidase YedK
MSGSYLAVTKERGRKRAATSSKSTTPASSNASPSQENSHLHARSETIDTTMTWMEPFSDSRGMIFAKEFNIGEELPNGKTKQWICARKDGKPVAIPVIYAMTQLVQGNLWAFVLVTQDSVEPLNGKDNRMPALLGMTDIPQWIGEKGATTAELKAMLVKPYSAPLTMRDQPTNKPKAERNTTRARPKREKPEPGPGLF